MRNDEDADALSAWAENFTDFGPNTQIYTGAESRKVLAELLGDKPASGPEEVTRRLRGRPSLDPHSHPGSHSRQLNVRIGADLSGLMERYVGEHAIKSESELVRTALTEFFDRHSHRV